VESFHHLTHYILIFKIFHLEREECVGENVKNNNGLEKLSPVNMEHKPINMSYADAVRKK